MQVDADHHAIPPRPDEDFFQQVEPSVEPLHVFVEVEVRVDLLEVARHLEPPDRPAPFRERLYVVFRRVLGKHRSAQLWTSGDASRIAHFVALVRAWELVERKRLYLERRDVELHAPRHVLQPERNADLADRRSSEVCRQLQRRPVEVAAFVVRLRPAVGAGRRIAVVEHELEPEVGLVRSPDSPSSRSNRRAYAACRSSKVELRVRRAARARSARVDDDDIALARRVAAKRPFHIGGAKPEGRRCECQREETPEAHLRIIIKPSRIASPSGPTTGNCA